MNWKLSLIVSLFLVGCGSAPVQPVEIPEPVVITEFVTPDCGEPPRGDEIELLEVTWQVLPNAEGDQMFCLSGTEYGDLGHNTAEIKQGVRQLRLRLNWYQECLDDNTE